MVGVVCGTWQSWLAAVFFFAFDERNHVISNNKKETQLWNLDRHLWTLKQIINALCALLGFTCKHLKRPTSRCKNAQIAAGFGSSLVKNTCADTRPRRNWPTSVLSDNYSLAQLIDQLIYRSSASSSVFIYNSLSLKYAFVVVRFIMWNTQFVFCVTANHFSCSTAKKKKKKIPPRFSSAVLVFLIAASESFCRPCN